MLYQKVNSIHICKKTYFGHKNNIMVSFILVGALKYSGRFYSNTVNHNGLTYFHSACKIGIDRIG